MTKEEREFLLSKHKEWLESLHNDELVEVLDGYAYDFAYGEPWYVVLRGLRGHNTNIRKE